MKIATNVFPIKICLVIVLMEDKANTCITIDSIYYNFSYFTLPFPIILLLC